MVRRFDGAFLQCAANLLSLDDQAARMEIGIRLERKPVILLGKHLTAGRGVVRPGSAQIRSLRRGGWHAEKYQQHQRIEGFHKTLPLNSQQATGAVRLDGVALRVACRIAFAQHDVRRVGVSFVDLSQWSSRE